MKKIHMHLKKDSYDILIKNDALKELNTIISKVYKNKNIFIISDYNVSKYYLKSVLNNLKDYNVKYVLVEAGEKSKSFETYEFVIKELLNLNIKRNELLIALGGGVIGDLTGFVASTIYRGNPYIQIPTSLLAQMDSSIGGKTGIDFYDRKNLIGAFKQPLKVIIDPNTLKTLPIEEFNNGMAELIKHAFIGDKKIIDLLANNNKINEEIIYRSLNVKRKLVEKDLYDQHQRMFLNFGHTFGHIIELENNIRHGEAVSIGMLMAIQMGIDLNISDSELYDKLKNILEKYNLPTKYYNYKEYLKKCVYDKKNLAGNVTFVLLKKIGYPIAYTIKEDLLNEC